MPTEQDDPYVSVLCWVKYVADRAVLITTKECPIEVWVPRSLLAYESDRLLVPKARDFEQSLLIREWFINKYGLTP